MYGLLLMSPVSWWVAEVQVYRREVGRLLHTLEGEEWASKVHRPDQRTRSVVLECMATRWLDPYILIERGLFPG